MTPRLKLSFLTILPLLFLLVLSVFAQDTYNFNENNRIFLYYPDPSQTLTTRLYNLKNTYPIGSSCSCNTVTGDSLQLSISECTVDTANSIVIQFLGSGFCNLTYTNGSAIISSEIDSFLVISDMYISPNGRELRTDIDQQFELKYFPSTISFLTFSMFFDQMSNSVRSSIAPIYSFSIQKTGNTYGFTIPKADVQSMLQLTSFDSMNRYKKIDFEVVLDSNIANPTMIPVTDGILFYNSISMANIRVSPTLIRFDEETTISFSVDSVSSYLFSPTNSLVVKICGTVFTSAELLRDSSSTSSVLIISETLVKAKVKCSDSFYRNGKSSVGYSQGGSNSQFINMDVNIYDFISSPNIAYDGSGYCSIFGLNNFTITIPQETNFYRDVTNNSVRLSLVELDITNSPYSLPCTWLSDRNLACPCPSTFEYLFTPPQELNFYFRVPTMTLSVQEQQSLRSSTIIGNPKILYGQYLNPRISSPTAMYSFNFRESAVYSSLQINVVDIEEIYVPLLFNYTFYLSSGNILNSDFIIGCTNSFIAQAGKYGVTCGVGPFYTTTRMRNLCGCTLSATDTLDSNYCLSNCNINVGLAISKEGSLPISYWTSNSFSILPPLDIKSIYPDTILMDNINQVEISVVTSLNSFGQPSPGNSIYYKWIKINPITEQELSDQYEGTATFSNSKKLSLSKVSANTISTSGTYILKLSFDGQSGTFSKDHGNRRLSVIIPSELSIAKFEQYNIGANNTAIPAGYSDDTISPVESKFRVIGTNFPISEIIKVKFTVIDQQNSLASRSILAKISRKNYRKHIRNAATKIQKRLIQEQLELQESTGTISFLSDCSGYSSTEIRCTSPNILTSGILLPLKFNVSISFDGSFGYGVYNPKKDGSDYLITVRESEVPVIVQAIPNRAPINPTDDTKGSGYFTVTLKGITTDVVRCVLEYSMNNNIRVNYTGTSGLSSTEFRCVLNAGDLKILVESYNSQAPFNSRINFPDKTNFKIYLETTTNLRSDGFLFELYEHPNIEYVTPLEVEAKGGDMVAVKASSSGAKFSSSDKIYFKLGDFTSSVECLYLGEYDVNCTSPSHPDGYAKVSVSYNNYQYSYAKDPILIKACSIGYTAEDYEKTCTECSVGQYKPLEGFFSCIPCEIGSYNNMTAQSKCISCGAFKTTLYSGSSSQYDCDCEKGYYRRNGSDIISAECWPCPSGATCSGGSSLPKPLSGYWWDAETTKLQSGRIVIVKCDEPNAELRCPGNLTLEGRCATGYSGIKCVSCLTGLYFKSGDICKECNTDVQLRFLIVVAVVIVIALVLFKFAQLKVSHLSSASIAVSYFQIIAVFTVYNFEWPDSLQQAFDTLKFFNLNLDIFVPECIEIITYGLKWGLTIAMPVFISVLLVIAFGLECLRTVTLSKLPFIGAIRKHPKVVAWYNVEHPNFFVKILKGMRRDVLRFLLTPRSKREIIAYGDKFIHTFIVVVSFSYVFVITKAAEIFDCREVLDQGVKRLYVSADTTLYCFENTWWVYFSFALLTFIFFGLGTIGLFAYIIWKKNDSTKSYKFYARFRFLFVRFRNGRLFWEIIVILRKLAISAAIIFFSTWPIIVILFTMFVIFISFILQTHHVPYRRVFHNVMEYIVLLSTEFLLFSGLLFYVNEFPDEATSSALGYLCILTVIISSAAIILLIALDFLSQYLADRRIKKQLAEKQKNQKAILAGVNNSFMKSNDIELKEENSNSQLEPAEKSITIVDIPTQTNLPQTESYIKLPLKIRIKNGLKKIWDSFVQYLKKIEGESLDIDLDEYDDNRLWDVELMDRGLPIPLEPTFVDSNGNLSKKEDSSSKNEGENGVVSDENEIKLESDVSSGIQTAINPRTFGRLVGRSESDISLQSGTSQQNLLQ